MNRLFGQIFAVGSIVGALTVLTWGVYLINKNLPRRVSSQVRFQPPTQPNADKSLAHSPSHDSKFVGGIGIIEPAGEAVSIGTQMAGIVTKVFAVPGDLVKQGDPLFELDSRAARASLALAQANLQASQSQLRALEAEIPSLQAKVAAAEASLAQSQAEADNSVLQLQRGSALRSKDAIAEEELDGRRFAARIGTARVAEAEAKLRDATAALNLLAGTNGTPRLDVQRAAVAQAQAAVDREQVALDMHTIRSPLNATVLQVKIRAGEFAAAAVLANNLMTLGVTNPLHVRVDIDESEIPRFKPGSKAYASVRGRTSVQVPLEFVRAEPYVVPKRVLTGSVSERVDTRVLQLIYRVEPSAIQAVPGQQVDVYIEESPTSATLSNSLGET